MDIADPIGREATLMRRRLGGPGPDLAASVSSGFGVMRLPSVKVVNEARVPRSVAGPTPVQVSFCATAERLWSVAEVSLFLGIPVATLRAWRCQGRGPASVKLGRHVRYDPDLVRAWVAGQIP